MYIKKNIAIKNLDSDLVTLVSGLGKLILIKRILIDLAIIINKSK
jgi:hypothetical protein